MRILSTKIFEFGGQPYFVSLALGKNKYVSALGVAALHQQNSKSGTFEENAYALPEKHRSKFKRNHINR